MNVKNVKIDPKGDKLQVNIIFNGLIVASYEYMLFESASNKVIQHKKGNNQNPEDDKFDLPGPTEKNVGRIIDVRSNFVGLDSVNNSYKITVELFQGSKKLGEVSEKGTSTSSSKTAQFYITLEEGM